MLLTSSVVVGFPAWVIALILFGSADMPAALKMQQNHDTDVAPNVHLPGSHLALKGGDIAGIMVWCYLVESMDEVYF